MATATTGQLSQTLAQLRKRLAQRFGDVVTLTFTTNGTTTTGIDALNVNSATESMVGRLIVFSTGTKHRITTMVDSTSTLTFTPAAALAAMTASGQSVEVYNKRGKGNLPVDYDAAINAAINDAYPLGLIEVVASVVAVFDATSPAMTVPVSLVKVHSVETEDSDSIWHFVPRATRAGAQGWYPDAAAGQIRIQGLPSTYADGLVVRLTGYGRQDVLTADTDTCALNAEWIIDRAMFFLAIASLDKDSSFYGPIANIMGPRSDRSRTRVRTLTKPGSAMVRAT